MTFPVRSPKIIAEGLEQGWVLRLQGSDHPAARGGVGRCRDFRSARRKPLPLLKLDALPGRIAENGVEATIPAGKRVLRVRCFRGRTEDVRKGQMPMEKMVLRCDMADLCHHRPLIALEGNWIPFDLAIDFLSDRILVQTVLRPDERCTPRVGQQLAAQIVARPDRFCIELLFLSKASIEYRRDCQASSPCARFPSLIQGHQAQPLPRRLRRQLGLVYLSPLCTCFAMIALNRLKASSGIPRAISAASFQTGCYRAGFGVPEMSTAFRFHRLYPQADFAQFNRHRVEINAVNALADDVAQRLTL